MYSVNIFTIDYGWLFSYVNNRFTRTYNKLFTLKLRGLLESIPLHLVSSRAVAIKEILAFKNSENRLTRNVRSFSQCQKALMSRCNICLRIYTSTFYPFSNGIVINFCCHFCIHRYTCGSHHLFMWPP